MSGLRVFIPLSKIDVEKRLVYGIATAEEPDLSGEICDYASTKPLYQKWSDDVKKASGGKSVGNLRSMHGSTAAGKVTDIAFNDDARTVEICAKVVDDGEWKKCLEGVYTGFSQGGSYVKRWDDEATGLKRYTADPIEISLVDVPCLPTATFNVIKADGLEKRAFVSVVAEPDADAIKKAAEALAAGKTDKTWRDFADIAAGAITKATMADALAKLVTEPVAAPEVKVEPETKVEPEAAKTKRFEPANKWDCGCADHSHVTKHEAVVCMKKRAAEAAATPAPEPEALAKLEAALGIEKAKPATITAADVAQAHEDAAKAHLGAAELHEAMAAKDDTSADDAENHLDAAKMHRSAAKAHMRAAAMHAGNDAGADDASKKAGVMTQAAAAKSDGMFMDKALSDETLKKYSEDEARDGGGRWTGSGAAADKARSHAESVTHALAASAFSLGVGELGSRAGAKIGEKVGHYAGKALALAASKGNTAAGEGGAAVGEKVGHLAGGLAGRLYAESRAWHFVAGKVRKSYDPIPSENDDPSQWDADGEHQDAAATHRHMAAAHMALASQADTAPADADKHFAAAKANLMAAQKHEAAIGGTAADSSAAEDATDDANACSMDAVGVKKGAVAETLQKFSDDEARAADGKWTAGAIASHAAHAAIGGAIGYATGGPAGAVGGAIAGVGADSAFGAGLAGLGGGALGRAAGSLIGSGARMVANGAMRATAARTAAEDGLAAAKDVLVRGPKASHPAVYAAAQDAMRGRSFRSAKKVSEPAPDAVLEKTEEVDINRTLERFVTEMQALVKSGARNSKADASRLQQCHDILCDLGAKCDDGDDDAGEDDVEKLKVENAGLRKSVDDVNARLETVLVKVAEMGKRAAPPKAALRAVEKSEDNGDGSTPAKPTPAAIEAMLKALPSDEQTRVLMKLALANPVKAIA